MCNTSVTSRGGSQAGFRIGVIQGFSDDRLWCGLSSTSQTLSRIPQLYS